MSLGRTEGQRLWRCGCGDADNKEGQRVPARGPTEEEVGVVGSGKEMREEGEGSGSAARAAATGEGGGCGISMRSAQRWLQLRAREAVATAALADGRSRGDGAATEATLVGGRSRGDGAIAKVLATDEGGEEDSAEGVRLERRRR
ncbi:hypothetical protein BHE74_00022414 [Ensete ventricosum]|nr:hypothetical protein BHE74_00022414 [Ensete ventricosum]RZS17491.1 hypothetical protein BHM03_00049632 [Ensete ventricosum]